MSIRPRYYALLASILNAAPGASSVHMAKTYTSSVPSGAGKPGPNAFQEIQNVLPYAKSRANGLPSHLNWPSGAWYLGAKSSVFASETKESSTPEKNNSARGSSLGRLNVIRTTLVSSVPWRFPYTPDESNAKPAYCPGAYSILPQLEDASSWTLLSGTLSASIRRTRGCSQPLKNPSIRTTSIFFMFTPFICALDHER